MEFLQIVRFFYKKHECNSYEPLHIVRKIIRDLFNNTWYSDRKEFLKNITTKVKQQEIGNKISFNTGTCPFGPDDNLRQ